MPKLFRFGLYSLLLLTPVLVMTGCQREEPEKPATARPAAPPAGTAFQVLSLELGSALGADRRVIAPASVFGPTDTVYASVIGKGGARYKPHCTLDLSERPNRERKHRNPEVDGHLVSGISHFQTDGVAGRAVHGGNSGEWRTRRRARIRGSLDY